MIDHLSLHRVVTQSIDWHRPTPTFVDRIPRIRARCSVDGLLSAHERFIENRDRCRSLSRATQLLQAHVAVKERVQRRTPVSWASLKNVQALVLAQPEAPFRRGTAWAKNGTERYGYDKSLEEEFAQKIGDDEADFCHPIAKAVRFYLDVCFFHPFEDGNGRAARLGFIWILGKAGIDVSHMELLFTLDRAAGDRDEYLRFLQQAIRLCEHAVASATQHACLSREGQIIQADF